MRSSSAPPGSRTSTVPSTCAAGGCSCRRFTARRLPSIRRSCSARPRRRSHAGPTGGRPARTTHMQAISLEVIIAVVFGVTDPDRVERLRAATLALMRSANSRRFFLQTIVVTARKKGWDGTFPRVRRASAAIDAIVLEEVAERRRAGDLDQDDVLGMFLRARDEDGMPMPDDELCDAMRTLLLGGHETTASTLAWILERVSRHPDELARLQAAALDGDDDYIDAVIKEAMRLRPVFPITARLASAPFDAGGPDHPGRHARRPPHHARAPPSRSLPRPARVPARALPRHPRRHLHMDPVRRRTPPLHRRRVLADRDPDRPAHDAPPRPPPAHAQTRQNGSPDTPSPSSPPTAQPSRSSADRQAPHLPRLSNGAVGEHVGPSLMSVQTRPAMNPWCRGTRLEIPVLPKTLPKSVFAPA